MNHGFLIVYFIVCFRTVYDVIACVDDYFSVNVVKTIKSMQHTHTSFDAGHIPYARLVGVFTSLK